MALHLWQRSGLLVEEESLVKLQSVLKLDREDEHLRAQIIAYDSEIPPELLSMLSDDSNWSVYSRVAGNPNSPVKALIKLASNSNANVFSVAIFSLITLPTVPRY